MVTVLLTGGACGDGDNDATTVTSTVVDCPAPDRSPGTASVPHAILDAAGWTLVEAIDLPPDHLLADVEPVPSDWYAEYESFEPAPNGTEALHVKLTGLPVQLNTYRTALEALGFAFESTTSRLGPALVGTSPEAGAHPVVVALSVCDMTLELLAYDLTGDELVQLAAQITPVDAVGFDQAGRRAG